MATKRKLAGKKPDERNLNIFLIIAGAFIIALTAYIGYRAAISDRKLFSIGLMALYAGLLFESIRVSGSWKEVLRIFCWAYLFSLFSFLPAKGERVYVFENHIEWWPYFFIIFFALFFGIAYKDQVTAKLTEGITLLLSISLIYWAVDYGFTGYHNWFSVSFLTISLLFSGFSMVHALTHLHLSRAARLVLSIWSTVIMFAFAIDNMIRVFSNPDIESSYLSDGLYIGLQYFLLGVSVVYIMKNYQLLAAFLPDKRANYKSRLAENKEDHINRYSAGQVNIGQSVFCILFTGAVYWLNYTYQVLPRHTMIWLVLLFFPFILDLITILSRRKHYQ